MQKYSASHGNFFEGRRVKSSQQHPVKAKEGSNFLSEPTPNSRIFRCTGALDAHGEEAEAESILDVPSSSTASASTVVFLRQGGREDGDVQIRGGVLYSGKDGKRRNVRRNQIEYTDIAFFN